MTPAQAKAFMSVATQGGFSAGARSLNVSQPALTSQVRAIEQRYDVELFRRTSQGVHLTETGAALLPVVRRMFANFDEAVAYLSDVQGLRRGHLRVGSYGPYDVTRMVARYKALHPGLSVSVDFENSGRLAARLRNYELDVAVLDRIDHHADFHVLAFGAPSLIALVPRTPAWKGRDSVTADEMKAHVLICREPGSATRAAFDRLFASAKLAPHQFLQFGSREGVVNAVAEGAGLATIFDGGFIPADRVMKLAIKGVKIRSNVDVVCLREQRGRPIVAGFLDIALQLLAETKANRSATI